MIKFSRKTKIQLFLTTDIFSCWDAHSGIVNTNVEGHHLAIVRLISNRIQQSTSDLWTVCVVLYGASSRSLRQLAVFCLSHKPPPWRRQEGPGGGEQTGAPSVPEDTKGRPSRRCVPGNSTHAGRAHSSRARGADGGPEGGAGRRAQSAESRLAETLCLLADAVPRQREVGCGSKPPAL